MIIDSHQHFWKYNSKDYGWIGEDMHPLKRDFLPPELDMEAEKSGVKGSIAVQARQSILETECLLELAEFHSIIKGIVAWLPLVDSKLENHRKQQRPHDDQQRQILHNHTQQNEHPHDNKHGHRRISGYGHDRLHQILGYLGPRSKRT